MIGLNSSLLYRPPNPTNSHKQKTGSPPPPTSSTKGLTPAHRRETYLITSTDSVSILSTREEVLRVHRVEVKSCAPRYCHPYCWFLNVCCLEFDLLCCWFDRLLWTSTFVGIVSHFVAVKALDCAYISSALISGFVVCCLWYPGILKFIGLSCVPRIFIVILIGVIASRVVPTITFEDICLITLIVIQVYSLFQMSSSFVKFHSHVYGVLLVHS